MIDGRVDPKLCCPPPRKNGPSIAGPCSHVDFSTAPAPPSRTTRAGLNHPRVLWATNFQHVNPHGVQGPGGPAPRWCGRDVSPSILPRPAFRGGGRSRPFRPDNVVRVRCVALHGKRFRGPKARETYKNISATAGVGWPSPGQTFRCSTYNAFPTLYGGSRTIHHRLQDDRGVGRSWPRSFNRWALEPLSCRSG